MNQEKVTKILIYIRNVYENQIIYNNKVLDIFNGQLLKYVEESMQRELSAKSFARAKGRIPPINLLRQLAGKTNRTYSKPANRKTVKKNKADEKLLALAEKNLNVDNVMKSVSDHLTLCKYSAVEFVLDQATGEEIVNVVGPNQFVAYSDDPYRPNKMTAFIKLMGNRQKEYIQTVDQYGRTQLDATSIFRDVEFFHIWTDEYFYEIDMDGDIALQEVNPYGKIPVCYFRTDSEPKAMPTPDCDMFQMAILLPKILADLNYAFQFQSHSIMYGIDVDPSGLEMAPDAFWNLKSIQKGDQKVDPSIGTINPTVDSDKVMASYKSQLGMWLESRGLKTDASQSGPNDASGIAKQIDESDATSIREDKVRFMTKAEAEFWEMYKTVREVWVGTGLLQDSTGLTAEFEVATTFAEQSPMKDTKSTLEELKLMNDLGIVTPKMMLEMAFPNKTAKEIDSILEELKVNKEEAVANAQAAIGAKPVDELGDQNSNPLKEPKADNGFKK